MLLPRLHSLTLHGAQPQRVKQRHHPRPGPTVKGPTVFGWIYKIVDKEKPKEIWNAILHIK